MKEIEKLMYTETANALKGAEKRMFMARVVMLLGKGGQRLAEEELGWNRGTIRKGLAEIERGKPFLDKSGEKGRKKAEDRLPNLMPDMQQAIADLKKSDPIFLSTHYYTSISAKSVRAYLINQIGYADADLPTCETIRRKMRDLNVRYRRN